MPRHPLSLVFFKQETSGPKENNIQVMENSKKMSKQSTIK